MAETLEVFNCVKMKKNMDTGVVAVDVAVVQDEGDPSQFSDLDEAGKRKK